MVSCVFHSVIYLIEFFPFNLTHSGKSGVENVKKLAKIREALSVASCKDFI